MAHEKEDKIRIPCYGAGVVRVEGLSRDSEERMMASLRAGAYWIRVVDGKLEFVPIWKELPGPTEDVEMMPFWRLPTKEEKVSVPKLFDLEPLPPNSSPSISIQSLCGYNYSEENYRANAARLESFGFHCLRSRRGSNAQFWEIWYLPGLWSAKGELKDFVDSERERGKKDEPRLTQAVIDFLCRNVSFGTLDVSVQRAAMVIDLE